MAVIKKQDSLNGFRFWAQHYENRIPKYEVFRYIGHNKDTGIHYFESVTQKVIIGRSFYQLNQNGFKPFLIDTATIRELLGVNDAYI